MSYTEFNQLMSTNSPFHKLSIDNADARNLEETISALC